MERECVIQYEEMLLKLISKIELNIN